MNGPQENLRPGQAESSPDNDLTSVLNAASAGSSEALKQLFDVVYSELRAIAQSRVSLERPGHTLQATALVNEVYIRLLGSSPIKWKGRGHFFRAAADGMRRVLIDHARARNADKRGGGRAALSISGIANLADTRESAGILALDDAINRLEGVDSQAAAVVRLRFYSGLHEKGVAETLEISERTVRRDVAFARAWLRDMLEREYTQE